MANQSVSLKVEARAAGKSKAGVLRRKQVVPAVVYGPKNENLTLSVEELTVIRYSGRGFDNAIFKFASDDSKLNGISVLMKNVQVHPVSRKPLHVDFYALDMASAVRVEIEVRFEGKPIGLAEGGVLQILLREVEVECLPTQIPEALVANVANLELNDTLHVSDLVFPEGVVCKSNKGLALATVSIPADEPAETPAAAAATPVAGAAGAAAPAAGAAAPAAAGDKKAPEKSDKKK